MRTNGDYGTYAITLGNYNTTTDCIIVQDVLILSLVWHTQTYTTHMHTHPHTHVDVDVDVEQMYERRPQPLCPTLCTLSITFMYTS